MTKKEKNFKLMQKKYKLNLGKKAKIILTVKKPVAAIK